MYGFAGSSGEDIASVVRDAVHALAHKLHTEKVHQALEELLDLVVHENDFLYLFPKEWHAVFAHQTGRRTLRTVLETLHQLEEMQNGNLRAVGPAPNARRHEPYTRDAPS